MKKLITITEYGCPSGRIDTELAELIRGTTKHGYYHWSLLDYQGRIATECRKLIGNNVYTVEPTGLEKFDTHAGWYSYQILVRWGDDYDTSFKHHAITNKFDLQFMQEQEGVGSPEEGGQVTPDGSALKEHEVWVEVSFRERYFIEATDEESAEEQALDLFHNEYPMPVDADITATAELS